MPAPTSCPIIEVDRALATYINTREETLKIRRTLSKYLTNGLRPVTAATQNQHLNHECPQNVSATPTNAPGLGDLRSQYLQALRARSQAQARQKELQFSLADLQHQYVDENPTQPQSDYESESARSYVALIRQRRRLAELEVVQNSLEQLLVAKPSSIGKDPKTLVDDMVGAQPDLPAERLEQLSPANDDQTWLFKLKQEVLDARSTMERANNARAQAQNEAIKNPSLEQQVFALERARDEIVEWVQDELAKLEEESIFLEDASPVKKSLPNPDQINPESAESRIRDAYGRYTTSRESLVKRYESFYADPQARMGEEGDNVTNGKLKDRAQPSNETKAPSLPITKVLPHLPHLTQIANSERSLLQQSVYLQTQIASADQDIEEALLRLSAESHLLPAGSKQVQAWSKAAEEAEAATTDAVKQNIKSSQQELASVGAIVELSSVQSKVLASS